MAWYTLTFAGHHGEHRSFGALNSSGTNSALAEGRPGLA
jgi:hypothetical protein